MNALQIATRAAPWLGVAGGAVAGGVLFLHLMQTNQAFAEAIGAVSPSLANQFSCSCPLCAARAQCTPPTFGQSSLSRLDNGGLERLLAP